ncbi:MAG TPA: kelch repeat-containing protein [Candidatus Acidoferrum sp.]|nr:kelch repeat-containing protein [Candidatus Acidoferrum sp.]
MKATVKLLFPASLCLLSMILAACSGVPGGNGNNNGNGGGNTTGPFTIGGTVTGMYGSGLILQNNGGDNLTVNANGTFTFKTAIANQKPYAVTVSTEPSNPTQTCSVTNGTGSATANVTTVQVLCAAPNATISVSVSGLTGTGLVVQNNANDSLTINANGTYQFKNTVTGTYAVTVLTQPLNPTEICTVANGSGTATTNAVTINVSCVLSYTIGGTVNGLEGSGLVLQDNNGDNLKITASGVFTFPTQLATGTNYAVTVFTQPSNPAQTCVVTNGTGPATSNITTVVVTCPAVTYTVGGVVVGVQGPPPAPPSVNLPISNNSFVIQNNSGDNLTVTQNGPFTFPTPVNLNGAYNVNVFTSPSTQQQSCWTFNFKGVVTGNVTSVVVDCGHDDWAWISGTKTAGTIQAPQYGSFPSSKPPTLPNPYTNTPGARNFGAGWTDASGNLWLFGGQGWELSGNSTPDTLYGNLNDLWECQVVFADTNHCQWQLVNGYSTTAVTFGTATTQGAALIALAQHQDNGPILSGVLAVPTSRWGASTWTDPTKTQLWVFGGNGNGTQLLNDLWMFNTSTLQWTFVSGSATGGDIGGTYTGATPYPGSRWGAVTWTDKSGNVWLFGGFGYDANSNVGFLNDLWKFNGSVWTFVSGGATNTINQNGVYSGAAAYPGGRQEAVAWTDASGNLWLFGGEGEDATGTTNGILNDLWMYNITANTWTFVAGSNTANQNGVYGTQPLIGSPNTAQAAGTVGLTGGTTGTVPGSRRGSAAWTDANGTLWLYGGWGLDSKGTNGNGYLNDLWAFDTTTSTWTWVKGSNTGDQNGNYGSLTRPYAPYVLWTPGGRSGATYWIDGTNQLWIFGGQGYDSTSTSGNGFLNDLWRYVPFQ